MAQTMRVTGRATTVFTDTEGALGCFYHSTCVAKRAPDGRITLNTGGWRTVTTKLRMNQFANQHCNGEFSVYQSNGLWFVRIDGQDKPFDAQTITFNPRTMRKAS